jgi:hypothetical protein
VGYPPIVRVAVLRLDRGDDRMNLTSVSKLAIGASLACAMGALVAFLTMKFEWPAALVAASIGSAVGFFVFQTVLRKLDISSARGLQSLRDTRRHSHGLGHRNLPDSHASPADSGFLERMFFIFDRSFLSLPRYQRLASIAFLLQALISLLLIFIFCVAQAAGFDVQVPKLHSLSALFANSYAANSETAFAGARFYNLFIPLVSLYAVTLACFVIAFVHSLASILRDVGKNGILLAAVVFFSAGLWVVLFADGPPVGRGIQRMIAQGDALGYVTLFVFFPLVWTFLAAGLPKERRT